MDKNGLLWVRDRNAETWAGQLVDLWVRARDADPELLPVVPARDNEVSHVGRGILSLGMTVGIDLDSSLSENKAIYLREEQRDAAVDAVDANVQKTKVVLTGSPGAGKTFGTMAAIVGELLSRNEVVVRSSKESRKAHLFKRRDDGTINAWIADWKGKGTLDVASDLFSDERVTLVVDPTENPNFVGDLVSIECRVIHVPADDSDKHYHNWNKYSRGLVLYTNPPTANEAVIICRELWNKESTRTGQPRLEGDALSNEIWMRILLVGPYMRYITNWSKFEVRIEEIKSKAKDVNLSSSIPALVEASIERHYPMESGKLQSTFVADPIPERALADERWKARERKMWVLNPLPMYLFEKSVAGTIEKIRGSVGGAAGGWIFERCMCLPALLKGGSMQTVSMNPEANMNEFKSLRFAPSPDSEPLSLPKRTLIKAVEETYDGGYDALKNLNAKEEQLLRLPTDNFPAIDFASSVHVWYNAKVGQKTTISCKSILRLLKGIDVINYNETTRTWSTNTSHDAFKATLYLVSYDDLRSPVQLKGTQEQRTLVLDHVNLKRLSFKNVIAPKDFLVEVKEAVKHLQLEHTLDL